MQSAALRYFLEVIKTGSITDASTRLNVAGSAISRQIAKLEEELGATLFERHPRGMIPSPAGELLAHHARRTLLDQEHVVTEIKRLRGLTTGLVTVGGSEGFAAGLLPDAILAFRDRHPGIRFDVRVLASAQIITQVRDGDVDIGLTFVLTPQAGVRVETTRRAPLVALLPPDHPLTRRDTVTLTDMTAYPLALPDRNATARQLFDIACGLEGIMAEPVFSSNHLGLLWRFVASGGGISIAGSVSPSPFLRDGSIVARRIIGEGLDQRRYQLLTMSGRHLPEAVAAFLSFLQAYLRDCEDYADSHFSGHLGQTPGFTP